METTVCIAGGGPAGMMLGLLLARAGIDVTVLEKHADFFRDFRGDTIHPSTVEVLAQLGLLERLRGIDHTAVKTLDAVLKGVRITAASFTGRRGHANRLLFMPQWDLLNLLAEAGRALPNFHLLMGTQATGLMREGDAVTGVRARTEIAQGAENAPDLEITAALTIAADGRTSVLRDAAGLAAQEYGIPVDVLWFRVPRPAGVNPPDTIAYITDTDLVITIPRTGYYQTALLIPKGTFEGIKAHGLAAFRRQVLAVVPFLSPTFDAVRGWDDVKLLTVQIDRLPRWHRPGLLAIGDAAHAMSPAFGVGINYAVQDAVAAANLLIPALRSGALTEDHLAAVQARREPPVRRMQAIQRRLHAVIGRPGGGRSLPSAAVIRRVAPPLAYLLRPIIGRLIGWGFRPEHIDPDVLRPSH
jgi:2-polyprenyl-6-methoxyphenol hydroxylase-like FAD-dependent oxidoreductase